MRHTEKPRIKGHRGNLSLTNRVPCRWHVGKTSANTGFLLTAFHRKAGNRIHLPRTAPPASLVGFYWWGKIRGFEPTQIQHAGGMLAKPVQTLVFGYISHRKIWQSCIRQTGKQAYLSVAEVFVPLNSYSILFFRSNPRCIFCVI